MRKDKRTKRYSECIKEEREKERDELRKEKERKKGINKYRLSLMRHLP